MTAPAAEDRALLRARMLAAGIDAQRTDDSLRALDDGDARALVRELLLHGLWNEVVDEAQPEPQWIERWRALGPSGFPYIDLPALERLLAAGVDVHDLTGVVRSAQVLMACNLAQSLDTPTLGLGWDLPEAIAPHLACATGDAGPYRRLPALHPLFGMRDPARRHGQPRSPAQRQWAALSDDLRVELLSQLRRGGRAQAAALWKRHAGGELRDALAAVEEIHSWLGAGE